MGSVTSFDDLADVSKDQPKRPVRRKKPSNSGSGGSASKMSISSSEQSNEQKQQQLPLPVKQQQQKIVKTSQQQAKVTRNSLRRSKRRSLKKRKVKNNVNHWKKSEEESSTYSTDASDNEGSSDKFKASNGDIYTKVAMPRSRSFMKINNSQGGGANHYNLQDLFKELKDQVSSIVIQRCK